MADSIALNISKAICGTMAFPRALMRFALPAFCFVGARAGSSPVPSIPAGIPSSTLQTLVATDSQCSSQGCPQFGWHSSFALLSDVDSGPCPSFCQARHWALRAVPPALLHRAQNPSLTGCCAMRYFWHRLPLGWGIVLSPSQVRCHSSLTSRACCCCRSLSGLAQAS